MKSATRLALVLGLAAMIFLIVREGGPPILSLLATAGWVLLWLVPLHVLPLFLDVLGWRLLLEPFAAGAAPRIGALLWIASVREAVNRLLPVANIGGEIVGIRLLVERGFARTGAAASVVVEVFLTLVSQYIFVTLGVVLLLRAERHAEPLGAVVLGLAVAAVLIAILFVALRYGSIFDRLKRLLERAAGWMILGGLERLDEAIRDLYDRRGRLAGAVFWQVAGLVTGSLETWLALRWLGHSVAFGHAVALESLTQAVRQFIFLVPAGLGVQEAGLIGFGSLLGLPGDVAITLSLVKRMREIVFGVPALVSWQWAEGWRGWTRRA
jgi:putative membrane protein